MDSHTMPVHANQRPHRTQQPLHDHTDSLHPITCLPHDLAQHASHHPSTLLQHHTPRLAVPHADTELHAHQDHPKIKADTRTGPTSRHAALARC